MLIGQAQECHNTESLILLVHSFSCARQKEMVSFALREEDAKTER
jgi:hypothetical protein